MTSWRLVKMAGCIAAVMVVLCACMRTSSTEDMSDYLQADVPLLMDRLALFPEEKALSEEAIRHYRAENKSSLLFDDMFFLLSCTYPDAEYANEEQRLIDSGAEYRDDLFCTPAYVMIFTDGCYEYALLDPASNTIIYVYAQTADWNIFNDFPEQYIPTVDIAEDIFRYT